MSPAGLSGGAGDATAIIDRNFFGVINQFIVKALKRGQPDRCDYSPAT